MSTSHAFKAGWLDKLAGLPEPHKYSFCRTGLAVAYERGRHCAALWEWEVTRAGGTITAIVPYGTAHRRMSKDLRKLIAQERKFCSLKTPQWSV